MSQLELRIPPLVVWATFAAAVAALAYLVPVAKVAFPGHHPIAIACLLGGIAIAIAGVLAFRSARTTVNPRAPDRTSAIVTTGIYRWSRNPMYLGMALSLFGVAAWHSSLPGYLLVPMFCAYMTEFQIKPEERTLVAIFGQEFSKYMTKVHRWI